MAQLPLITRRDLLNHGASNDFVDQFRIRPIEVQVQAGGALGVMTVAWRFVGDTNWLQLPEPSEPGASWTWDAPDPAFASIVFPTQAYTIGWTWTIASNGAVTAQGAAPANVTATRYDVVAGKIAARTSDFVTWTQPRAVPPILSIGDGQKGWLAALVIYDLKSRQGMTPAQAGSGDENLRLRAEDAERNIKAIGRSDNRPPDLVDSSPNGQGRGIPLMPRSRSPRGFGDFS